MALSSNIWYSICVPNAQACITCTAGVVSPDQDIPSGTEYHGSVRLAGLGQDPSGAQGTQFWQVFPIDQTNNLYLLRPQEYETRLAFSHQPSGQVQVATAPYGSFVWNLEPALDSEYTVTAGQVGSGQVLAAGSTGDLILGDFANTETFKFQSVGDINNVVFSTVPESIAQGAPTAAAENVSTPQPSSPPSVLYVSESPTPSPLPPPPSSSTHVSSSTSLPGPVPSPQSIMTISQPAQHYTVLLTTSSMPSLEPSPQSLNTSSTVPTQKAGPRPTRTTSAVSEGIRPTHVPLEPEPTVEASESSKKIGPAIGGAVGGVAVMGVLALGGLFFNRRRRRAARKRPVIKHCISHQPRTRKTFVAELDAVETARGNGELPDNCIVEISGECKPSELPARHSRHKWEKN